MELHLLLNHGEPAGSIGCRRTLAHDVDGAAGSHDTGLRDLVGSSTTGRLLATWVSLRRPGRYHLRCDGGRRLGGRLFEPPIPHASRLESSTVGDRRAMGTQ